MPVDFDRVRELIDYVWKAIILIILISVVGDILAGGIILPELTNPPTFDLSYSSSEELTSNSHSMHGYSHAGCEKQLYIDIKSVNKFINKYKNVVSLSAVADSPKINITLIPRHLDPGSSGYSIAHIKIDQNTPKGDYRIELYGEGDDGKKDVGVYILTIFDPKMIKFTEGISPNELCGDNYSILIDNTSEKSTSKNNCTKILYNPLHSNRLGWAGFDIGITQRNSKNQTCQKPMIRFKARGEKGGEALELRIGGLSNRMDDNPDIHNKSIPITLSKDWNNYEFEIFEEELDYLVNEDYKGYLICGFGIVLNRKDNLRGCAIYLDDVEYIL